MREIILLLSLVFSVGSASLVRADDAVTLEDSLKAFASGLIEMKPKLYASLNQHERDLANQVEFELDRTDLGVAPKAAIENGRRIVRFPLGFVFALGAFSRSLAPAYCCDSRVQAGLDDWLGAFDASVKRMESDKRAPPPPDYPDVNQIPSLCEAVLKDRTYCLSFQNDIQNPLHHVFWQTCSSLSYAVTIMVAARELSEHLLGHLPGDANQNMDSYDKVKATDRKGAEIFLSALQNPYLASPAFAFSVVVEGEGIVSDDHIDHPSTLCRSLAVNSVIFQSIVNDLRVAETHHLPEAVGKRQAFQDYLDKILSARHDRCSNN